MNNKIGMIILGLMLSLVGVLIATRGEYYDIRFGFHYNFGQGHFYLGIGIFCIGLLFIIFSYIYIKPNSISKNIVLICPKCEKVFYENDVHSKECPECHIKAEYLEGYYERHPEKKKV